MFCSVVSGGATLEENFGAIRSSGSVALHRCFPAGVDGRERCLFYLLESKYDVRASQSTNRECGASLVTVYEDKLPQSSGKD